MSRRAERELGDMQRTKDNGRCRRILQIDIWGIMLMTGFRTSILAVNILNSLTSEGLQTDISPVCPLSSFFIPSYLPGLSHFSLSDPSSLICQLRRGRFIELMDSKQTKNVWARDE